MTYDGNSINFDAVAQSKDLLGYKKPIILFIGFDDEALDAALDAKEQMQIYNSESMPFVREGKLASWRSADLIPLLADSAISILNVAADRDQAYFLAGILHTLQVKAIAVDNSNSYPVCMRAGTLEEAIDLVIEYSNLD